MKIYKPRKMKSPTAKAAPLRHRQMREPHIKVADTHDVIAHPWSVRGRARKTHNL